MLFSCLTCSSTPKIWSFTWSVNFHRTVIRYVQTTGLFAATTERNSTGSNSGLLAHLQVGKKMSARFDKSACPHVTIRIPMDGFSRNFTSERFLEHDHTLQTCLILGNNSVPAYLLVTLCPTLSLCAHLVRNSLKVYKNKKVYKS
jgi:hypothetical protein